MDSIQEKARQAARSMKTYDSLDQVADAVVFVTLHAALTIADDHSTAAGVAMALEREIQRLALSPPPGASIQVGTCRRFTPTDSHPTRCMVCGVHACQHPSQPSPEAAKVETPTVTPSGWNCPQGCGYNGYAMTTCGACGLPRPAVPLAPTPPNCDPEICNHQSAPTPPETAERTLASIAAMLGWENVPPRETLEREIAALKHRASSPSPGAVETPQLTVPMTEEELEWKQLRQRAEQAEQERDQARQVVRDTLWMAGRYADGRRSYAVGMYQRALAVAEAGGFSAEAKHAVDGMAPEWPTLLERAEHAEASLAQREAEIARWIERAVSIRGAGEFDQGYKLALSHFAAYLKAQTGEPTP